MVEDQGSLHYSQDIRGAYIQTKKFSGYTYSLTVTLFTDPSINISRPAIPIDFGDGTTGSFTLAGTSNGNNIVVKTYLGTHTYAGPGTYNASYTDASRVAGIKNMTSSQTQQIYVESRININSWVNVNTGPTLSFYPINFGVNGNQVVYNSASSDADGDSLSYQMTSCLGNNYLPSNATIDNATGVFSFSKDSLGLYAFTFLTKEWRKNTSGIYNLIGSSQLDFLMDVTPDVGMREVSHKQVNLFAFPNPASDELNIKLDGLTSDNKKIEIMNAFGQIVLKSKFVPNVNISDLPKGIYFLKVSTDYILSDIIKFIKE